MRKLSLAAFALAAMIVLVVASCSSDDKSTEPTPQGFTPDGMKLISAKNQHFSMGSADGLPDEAPVHTVSFTKSFWMDTTEITQSDFNSVMTAGYTNYTAPSWNQPYGVGASYPAYYVYWSDAVLYCNARSRQDGLDSVYTYTRIIGTPGNLSDLEGVVIDYTKNGYRLPTEAEWEYACRGGVSEDFYWGKSNDPYPVTAADSLEFNNQAVWYANSWTFGSDSSAFGNHIVATKLPNPFGLYDMSGNVYEWCNDWYGEYTSGAVTDPDGPDTGDWHCLRGGSWGSHATYLRSANRTFSIPDYLYYFIGFRTVLPVE
jgi:formylglycine-generating enzyme required for sulfatase activity